MIGVHVGPAVGLVYETEAEPAMPATSARHLLAAVMTSPHELAVDSPKPGSRFTPRAGVRVQLFGAAIVWLVGASILIVRGVGYVQDRYWHAWVLGAALAIAVLKSRFLLDRIARKAVARIRSAGAPASSASSRSRRGCSWP